MLSDFKMIVHKLSRDYPYINIYPLGDVHIGSKECNLPLLVKWREQVLKDPHGYVVIVGDLMNMALKTSKSNVYEDVMSPYEQKEFCYEFLLPIKDRILACCSGNHERRNLKEVGTNPLYDVLCRLHIEDLYREYGCFVKINVGAKNKLKQWSYGMVLTHGSSPNKDARWNYTVDNCDLFISGHTHQAKHVPQGKLRLDLHNETVSFVGYQEVVVIPFQEYGSYALGGKYTPNYLGQFQTIRLSGSKKLVGYHFE